MKSIVLNLISFSELLPAWKRLAQMFRECLIAKVLHCFLILMFFTMLEVSISHGIVIDRLAAYVNDTAITLSGFNMEFQKMSKTTPDISKKEVINSIINRTLLIKEARKMRLEANTEDELVNLYLDIKIRSRLFITEDAIFNFYKEYIGEFKGHDYLLVKDQIETYLLEKEFNEILKKHIEELRQNAEIKIFITNK